MICSLKQSPCVFGRPRPAPPLAIRLRPALSVRSGPPPLPALSVRSRPSISPTKDRHSALHLFNVSLSHSKPRRGIEFSAAADRPPGVPSYQPNWALSALDRGIDLVFAGCMAMAIFCLHFPFEWFLQYFPFPWLCATLLNAGASLFMLATWAIRILDPPDTDLDFWKSLAPVAAMHGIGLVALTVSLWTLSTKFTHIFRCAEPAFRVLLSKHLLGEMVSLQVSRSIRIIIGGCTLAAITVPLDIPSFFGFIAVMVANLAFASRNILSERETKGKKVKGVNYYACLSMLSFLFLAPFAVAFEGPKMWAAGWKEAVTQTGTLFFWDPLYLICSYNLYNIPAFVEFPQHDPFEFVAINTISKIMVCVVSFILLDMPFEPINALGAAIAILGVFLYFKESYCKNPRMKSWLL